MNTITKNMEAIFLALTIVAGATTYASAAIPQMKAAHMAQVAIAGEKMAIVKVSAKRMTEMEKARSL